MKKKLVIQGREALRRTRWTWRWELEESRFARWRVTVRRAAASAPDKVHCQGVSSLRETVTRSWIRR